MLSLLEPDAAIVGDDVQSSDDRLLFEHTVSPRAAMSFGLGSIASVGVHAVAAVAIVALASVRQPTAPKAFLFPPRLVSVVYIPSAPLELPVKAIKALPAPEAVIAPEPVPERPLVPVRPIETAALVMPDPKPVPAVIEAPRPPLPLPAPPAPTVGLFPGAAAAARSPEPAARVEAAGFDAPVKATADSTLGKATVGAFESAANAGARQPGSAAAASATVVDSGFGRPSSSAPAPTQQARVIRETGFGSSDSREQPKTAQPPAEVKQAGFANAATFDAPRRVASESSAPTIIPVEILSKPTPNYTEEARTLKIEGEVVLEVDFLANGSLRIIRVIRGLGHGLDEAAIKAAQQIQFKPALSQGRPVDHKAHVQIVFRLA